MNRLARMLLALCLVLASCVTVAETGTDRARLEAARRLIIALDFGKIFMFGINQGYARQVQQNPEKANEMRWVLEKFTPEGAIERLAPIYAEYLTASQSDELRKFYSSGPGRKIWVAISEAALAQKPPTIPTLTPEENRQVNAFNNSVALRTMNTAQAAIKVKSENAGKLWMQEIVQNNLRQTGRQVADALDPAGTGTASNNGAPSGPMAEFVTIMRDYNERNQKSILAFQSSTDAIDLATVLKPGNLTSRQGIAEGRSKLDRYETVFTRRWREYDASTDELMQSLRQVRVSEEIRNSFMAGAEKGMSTAYERALRMQENQRNLLAIFREMLNLADEKFGKIRFEENRLIFESAQDLQAYETLRERLNKEAATEKKIGEEEEQARINSLNLLRGEKQTKP